MLHITSSCWALISHCRAPREQHPDGMNDAGNPSLQPNAEVQSSKSKADLFAASTSIQGHCTTSPCAWARCHAQHAVIGHLCVLPQRGGKKVQGSGGSSSGSSRQQQQQRCRSSGSSKHKRTRIVSRMLMITEELQLFCGRKKAVSRTPQQTSQKPHNCRRLHIRSGRVQS